MHGLLVAVLAFAALAFVVAPLRRSDTAERFDLTAELEEKKAAALNAILDLESERDVGKLSATDFSELRAVYEAEALDALHQLDGIDATEGSDPLEQEIALIRQRLSNSAPCPNCGAERKAGVSPCPACGA